MHGKPLAYLDNANSTQKPRAVIDAESRFYAESYAGVHRAVYELAERATRAYEGGRERVRRLLNAPDAREVILLRGTTEAINLVASSFGRARVGAGRRDPDHRDGAPLEHRAVADGLRGARRDARGRADRRPRRVAAGRVRARASVRARGWSRSRTSRTRSAR